MNLCKVQTIIRLRINSDGNGVRSVIFLQDCPLACEWCCNPETRFGNNYQTITDETLYSLIARDTLYFDATGGGITFSGGEPLLQSSFISSFLEKYGKKLNANIETSLYAAPEIVESLIPHINEWYIDFKVFDEDCHIRYTGVSNELIKSNIILLSKKVDKDKIIIAFPIITEINDSTENVDKMIEFMNCCGLKKIDLHPYRKKRETKYRRMNLNCEPIPPLPHSTLLRITNQLMSGGIEVIEKDTPVERRKCDVLKAIRRDFCQKNSVPLEIEECSYKGRCKGTCPKCEEELDFLNKWTAEHN